MRRRLSGRMIVAQVVSLALLLVVGGLTFFRQAAPTDAFAAPPRAAAPSASIAPAPAAAPSAVASAAPSAKGEDDAPVDTAIAGPDGGVPTHPGAAFRSPFAKPGGAAPVRIKVGFLLNSVDDYDVKTGTFSADFFLSFTSAEPMGKSNLQFPNGKLGSTETLADRPTFKLFRMTGEFKSPADLRKYPYDSQDLKIMIEDDSRGVDQIRFVVDPDRTKLARGFRAVGWQVSSIEARVLSHSYPERFEGDDLYYGRYVATLGVDRFAASAAFKVYVPAFVIVFIALLGMWVPPEEMEVRSNAGAPMLAAAVLFHFSLMQELPATSYLTRADKLMLGVYISLVLGMISTWWMFLVKEETMPTVFRVARILVPVLTVIVMAVVCL